MHTPRHCWQLENLETRQLLSASVAVAPLATSAPAIVAPMTTTPSVVGTWKGSSIQNRKRGSQSLTINFTSQSHRGALAGTAVSGTTQSLTGTISGNSISLKAVGSNGTTIVTGTVSKSGKTITGTWVNGRNSGTFTISR
jgi:hypothetical protein